MLKCDVCKKRNGDLRQCMECNGFACSEHWLRCGDPNCRTYFRICLACQRKTRFGMWRTRYPEAMWVCQTCAKEAKHSQNFMCDLCGEHHEILRTCKSCDKRVCQKDYFWCSVKSCSHSHCRDCNEESSKDIEKIDGIWSCTECRESGKAQAHAKNRKSKESSHQHWKRRKTL